MSAMGEEIGEWVELNEAGESKEGAQRLVNAGYFRSMNGKWIKGVRGPDQLVFDSFAQALAHLHNAPGSHGRKDDAGKPRWDLLPMEAVAQVVDVLTFGAKKYAPENWRKVEGWRWRYYRAALGHVVAWWRGEQLDPETQLPHLAHAACCILFLLALDCPERSK